MYMLYILYMLYDLYMLYIPCDLYILNILYMLYMLREPYDLYILYRTVRTVPYRTVLYRTIPYRIAKHTYRRPASSKVARAWQIGLVHAVGRRQHASDGLTVDYRQQANEGNPHEGSIARAR